MTSAEVENLNAQIGELSQRLAAVELARDTGSETDSPGVVDQGGANEAQVIPQQKLHAFDITCDGREEDPWLVYLPDGCVRFGDFTPDRIDPEPDANTHLADLGTDIKDGGIYAHIYLELADEESGADDESGSDSASEPEVTGFPLLSIDTEPEQQPSEERMKVVNIQIATIKDGAVSQTVIGALRIGAENNGVKTIAGEEGEEIGSDPKPISGNVIFQGADKSGLKTTTYRDAQGRSYMLVDIERGEGDEDAEFGIHKLTIKGKTEFEDKEVRIFAEDDIEIPARKDVVESLNGETGDITIEGGHKVNVTKDGKTIIVSLDESKEDPERDPNTNCGDHPGSAEGGGGVIIGPAGGGGGGAGVPAEDGAGSSGVGCDC